MSVLFLDPTETLLRLQRDIDSFFGKPLLDLGLSGARMYPPINVFSDKNGLVVRAEMPGFKQDEIKLDVEPRRLTISGESHSPGAAEKGSFHRRERRYGNFARSVQLPEGLDVSNATAEYRHGILTLHIPKSAEVQPRRIEVKAA